MPANNKKLNKYMDCFKAEKAEEHEIDSNTSSSRNPWNNLQEPGKEFWLIED